MRQFLTFFPLPPFKPEKRLFDQYLYLTEFFFNKSFRFPSILLTFAVLKKTEHGKSFSY
jgi:hypothetical protein